MKNTTKKALTLSVLAAFALSMSFGFGTAAVAKAEDGQQATQTVTADFSDFTLNEKASVRKISPNGIRFQAIVGEKTRASLAEATDVTFGMLIAPTLGEDNKLTLEDVADTTVRARNLVTKVWTDSTTSFAETTSFTYNSALVGESIDKDFPVANYATPLNAVGYVQYTDGTGTQTVYTTNSATRSLVQSASLALANGESDSENVLSGIIDAVVPDALSVGAVEAMKYGDKTTLTVEGTQGLAVIWSSGNESVATVDKLTGEVTAVGIGTAEITATLGTRTATTTVSVQDKVGVISATQFAKAIRWVGSPSDAESNSISMTTDETKGTVAVWNVGMSGNSAANYYLNDAKNAYFADYDYVDIEMKIVKQEGKNIQLYFGQQDYTQILPGGGVNAAVDSFANWATFTTYKTLCERNTTAFAEIATKNVLGIRLNNGSSLAFKATVYIASLVGGYSDFEAANGTAIDLTAKYNGIKSATITPTGATQAETISDLTAWTPVEGTLSFTVGQTGWFDNSYTVNVTVADPVGTISARSIVAKGATSVTNFAKNVSLSLEDDETYGKVAVWNAQIPGNSWAHLTVTDDLYADFANYDYIDFLIKVESKEPIVTNNILIYPGQAAEYAIEYNTNTTIGIGRTTSWTTVTFAKTGNKGAVIFNAFGTNSAVTLSFKNNYGYTGDYTTPQELVIYIAKIEARKAEA